MNKKIFLLLSLLFAICLFTHTNSYAAKNPGEKLARGVMNMWNSQKEVFDNVHESMYHEGPLLGLLPGLLKGTGAFLTRFFTGVYDTLTFPIPIPKNYEPLIQPELNF